MATTAQFLKRVGLSVFNAPGNLVTGAIYYLFGGKYARDPLHSIWDLNEDPFATYPGLFGLILRGLGLRQDSKALHGFFYRHKAAISAAFWTSLLIAGAVILAAVFWPAAIAAVAGATVLGGLSIAAVVGSSALAQVAVINALAASAVFGLTLVVSGVRDLFFRNHHRLPDDFNMDIALTEIQLNTLTTPGDHLVSPLSVVRLNQEQNFDPSSYQQRDESSFKIDPKFLAFFSQWNQTRFDFRFFNFNPAYNYQPAPNHNPRNNATNNNVARLTQDASPENNDSLALVPFQPK